MKCGACEEELPLRATFCPRCGAAVDEDSSPTVTSVGPLEGAGGRGRDGAARPASGLGGATTRPPSGDAASRPGYDAARDKPRDMARTSGAERSRKTFTSSSAPTSRGSSSQGQYVAGTTLADRYRIVSLLGKGGMGEVYRAEDLKLNQAVALKFLPVAMSEDEAARERFYQEVRLAREISHANVCRVFDIGELDGRLFLTMEYVDGEDLGSLLRRIGQFPQAKGLDIARQMCAGLAAAHDHGVLHRDLKPGNIMLDGRGRVRITDFGLATLSEDMGAEEVSAGTPAYMAPEQLAGIEVTKRSDIYSLGLVLYEIFTGKKAYEAASLGELLRLRESSSPSSISALVKDIDPLTERVIQRCLERDPSKRPASAIEVAAALPGGDPLAAALAAGETPSPAMVAASGEKEGLRPAMAWACLLLTFVGLAAVALLSNQGSIVSMEPLPMSGEVLAAKAQELARSLGYTATPADSSYGFGRYTGFLDYVQKNDQSKNRWEQLKKEYPPTIAFWYRESPQLMQNTNFTWVAGAFPDTPPMRISGMVQEFFNPEGKLMEMLAVPPQLDTSTEAAPAPNWAPLFAAAGLDQKDFRETAPQWTPLVTSDSRAAWLGTWPGRTDLPLRVEAAAYHGKPVYFDLLGTWDTPDRMQENQRTTGEKIQSAIGLAFLGMLILQGVVLARKNVRAGRSDWKGAGRLALFVFVMMMVSQMLFAHHIPAVGELGLLLMLCGWSLIAASAVWLMYVALEPHVRKRWPSSLISWSRLLAGEILDPVVGRDLLIGGLTGIFWAVVLRARTLLPEWMGKTPNPPDNQLDFVTLNGIHITVGDILLNVVIFLVWSLAVFFLFFVVRLVLRKEWLAVAVTLALAAAPSLFGEHPIQGVVEDLLIYGIALMLLLRFGLLALVIAFCMNNVLSAYPLTGHLTEWYAQPTIVTFTVIAVLAIFGFYRATAGKSRLGNISLDG